MAECRIHIVLLGIPPVVAEGLSAVLSQTRKHYVFHRAEHARDLEKMDELDRLQVILVNPALLDEREKDLRRMQLRIPGAAWIGVQFTSQEILPEGLVKGISIKDTPELISSTVEAFVTGCSCDSQDTWELTEREIEVLALLVQGYSNKDVADKLFISPHTVITHRKNLMEKTGIRSLSGLTIYAITKNIISLDRPSSL